MQWNFLYKFRQQPNHKTPLHINSSIHFFLEKMGKKLALLVGCNYENTPYRLHGCQNDVLAMKEVLVDRFGFDENQIEVLMDKPESEEAVMPTGTNIKKALNKMVDEAEVGDVLFFHFSGHGTLVGKKKKEEAIISLDFNYITNVDIRKIVNRLPEGATFTILSDSCHSGGLIDKEKEQIGPSHDDKPKNQEDGQNICYYRHRFISQETVLEHLKTLTNIDSSDIGIHMLQLFGGEASLVFSIPRMERNNQNGEGQGLLKPLRPDEGILLSGCQANELCQDVVAGGDDKKQAYGAFSHAIINVLNKHCGPVSNKELVLKCRDVLKNEEHIENQHPCLYCSDENAQALFLSQV